MTRRFSIYRVFQDDLASKTYIWLFLLSSLSIVTLGLAVCLVSEPLQRGLLFRIPFTIGGMLAAVGIFEIWLGMWAYWARFDSSKPWIKRVWFFVLLFGLFVGSILYFLGVYIPQVRRMGVQR
jgi:H+/Cl- antiporter ClcA